MFLTGKRAVVTGAGRGIGAAIARALAREGARVLLAARTTTEIEQVAATIRDEGCEAWTATCDVASPASIEAMVAVARQQFGSVDILVNNAGIATSARLERIRLEDWNRVFAVNATGTFLCTQAFLPGMVENGWGRIVNIASIAARTGAPYIAAYTASKHAVLGFTRSVAAEVATQGVTVNAVCPGYVDTPMTEESVERIVSTTRRSPIEAREAILRTTPQRRLMDVEEIAFATVMLCRHEARGINGQAIMIDGGAILA